MARGHAKRARSACHNNCGCLYVGVGVWRVKRFEHVLACRGRGLLQVVGGSWPRGCAWCLISMLFEALRGQLLIRFCTVRGLSTLFMHTVRHGLTCRVSRYLLISTGHPAVVLWVAVNCEPQCVLL